MATHSMAMTSCGHSARGGKGRRSTSSSASEQAPAIAVRSAVSAIGSIADTAIRVAGSVPPKITMPTKPSSRPRRSREAWDGMMSVAVDMGRVVSGFAAHRTAIQSVHMAAMHGSARCNAAPDESDAGQKQQPQHDVAKIRGRSARDRSARRATRRSACRASPSAPARTRPCLTKPVAICRPAATPSTRAVEDLENAAALILGPAADAGPQDRQRARQAGKAAENAAGKSDAGIGDPAAEAKGHRLAAGNTARSETPAASRRRSA